MGSSETSQVAGVDFAIKISDSYPLGTPDPHLFSRLNSSFVSLAQVTNVSLTKAPALAS
jgi:hypothetical protein